MGKLLDRIKKANTLEGADILENSKFFVDEFHDTGIPALNIAMSGRPDGGYSRGSTLIGGESATFKTLFALQMAKAHLQNFEDSVFVFYDIEFGTNEETFKSLDIDTERVFHKPFKTVEDLTHDITVLLEELTEEDNVIFVIDSLGAASTKKSIDDTVEGKTTVDMTKAKLIKKFWNIVNPEVNVKKLSLFAIAQVYDSMDQYAAPVFGGGKANYYAPNNRWFITKSKEDELVAGKKTKVGSVFKVNVQKSRLIKEGSVFPIKVTWDGGIDVYSALLDIALQTGHVIIPLNDKGKQSKGYYSKAGDDKKWRRKATSCPEFWDSILEDEGFSDAVFKHYELGSLSEDIEFTEETEDEKD